MDQVTVFCDNKSAIYLTKHQVHHERAKHVDVKYHFIREVVAKKEVQVIKVATEDNSADMMTKALPTGKFQHCPRLLNLVDDS